ncbi:hypothetical protein IV69_GL001147 [Weissella confusa]|nr:hypothetical protein IV69_GL001147 [Weissella confusa]
MFPSQDFKSCASAYSAKPAKANNGIRTRDLYHGKVAFYQLNYIRMMPTKGLEPSTLALQERCSTN